MTHAERDPAPRDDWRPTSSAGIRRMAVNACRAAVAAAKDARKKPIEEDE